MNKAGSWTLGEKKRKKKKTGTAFKGKTENKTRQQQNLEEEGMTSKWRQDWNSGARGFKEKLGKQDVEKFHGKAVWPLLFFCLVLKFLLGKLQTYIRAEGII